MEVSAPENYVKFFQAIGQRTPKGVSRSWEMMSIAEDYAALTGADVPCSVLWKNLFADFPDMESLISAELKSELQEAPFYPIVDFELSAEFKELIAKKRNPLAVNAKVEPLDIKDVRSPTPTEAASSTSSVTNSEMTPTTTTNKSRKRKSASEQPEVEKSAPRLRKSESESKDSSTPKTHPKRKSAASAKEQTPAEEATTDSVKTRTRTKGKMDPPAKSTPQSDSTRSRGSDTAEKRKYEKRAATK